MYLSYINWFFNVEERITSWTILYQNRSRMIFMKFLFYLLLVFLVYYLIRSLFGRFLEPKSHTPSGVQGTSQEKKNGRSDIDESEIEDATFEEIDEDFQ